MIKFFINRPIFAMVIAILMVLIGVICVFSLPIAQYPQIVPPQVQVTSQFLGASSDAVSKTVTTPLERSINGVEGMLYMSSSSTNSGNSIINITFDVGYNVDYGAVDVLNYANTATPQLPKLVTKSGITIQKTSTNMVLVVNLVSPNHQFDSAFLSNYADINIAPVLNRVNGVGKVNNFGLLQYSIRIWLNPDKLASLKLSPQDVINAISEQNQQVGVGVIGQPPIPNNAPFQYQLNALSQLTEVTEYENIILRTADNGQIVRIKDVARVEMGAQSYLTTSEFNGGPTASLGIYQSPGSNAVQIAKDVKAMMQRLSKNFPSGIQYKIAYDTTEFVKESLKEVVKTLLIAILLVFMVVYLFLQNWRTTLIPAIAIPVSLIGTFALFLLFGFSINILSLLGLVLAIGLVVDDAIVVVENVEKKLEQGIKDVKEATLLATKEVQSPIIATTLILLAVFVPVAFIPGMTGQLYNQFALAIAFSVGLSGINSLTLSPALCGLLLKGKYENHWSFLQWFETKYQNMLIRYKNTLYRSMHHQKIILIIFLALAVITLGLFKFLPTSFLPEEDQGYFLVVVKGADGSSLYRTQNTVKKGVRSTEKNQRHQYNH